MRLTHVLMLAALAASAAPACASDSHEFDGQWTVTLTCPPFDDDDEARGYKHEFTAEVKSSELRGVRGAEGEPGWHLLTGRIAEDGRARLKLQGVVSKAAFAVNNARRGKPYSYGVRARFVGASGKGERVGKRPCDFMFVKTS